MTFSRKTQTKVKYFIPQLYRKDVKVELKHKSEISRQNVQTGENFGFIFARCPLCNTLLNNFWRFCLKTQEFWGNLSGIPAATLRITLSLTINSQQQQRSIQWVISKS